MFDKPSSHAQLTYLTNLGYTELSPHSMAEGSIAIAEMLKSGDSAAVQKAILAERAARQAPATPAKHKPHAEPEEGVQSDEATSNEASADLPNLLIGVLAAAVFWIVSRFIAVLAWVFSSLAILLIWAPSQTGLLAARSSAVKVETGRQKVIPWIGARDWRNMAAGCRVQAIAATRQVDALLVQASRNDRWLLLILRFATAAAAAIVVVALLWVF